MCLMRTEVLHLVRKLANEPSFAANPNLYVYDLPIIDRQVSRLASGLPDIGLYYAMKANPHQRILERMRTHPYVLGIEIASEGELDRALAVFHPDEVIFTGPGKTEHVLARAVSAGIRQLHVESVVEAVRVDRLVASLARSPLDILVRVNVAAQVDGLFNHATGKPSKFGIDESALPEALARIAALPGLRLLGLHLHAGSGYLEPGPFLAHFRHALVLTRDLRAAGFDIRVLDFGGGFGIDYEGSGRSLDVAAVGDGIAVATREAELADLRLIFELGRYLVGEAGYYVTEIVDIKSSQGRMQIITAGGTNHQRRPMAYKTNHPTRIIPMERADVFAGQPRVSRQRADIGGPLCTAADVLATDIYVEEARIGDLVAIGMSGAYGLSVGMVNFLNHPLAPEHFFG